LATVTFQFHESWKIVDQLLLTSFVLVVVKDKIYDDFFFSFELQFSEPSRFTERREMSHLNRKAGRGITLTFTLTSELRCVLRNQFFWDTKQRHEVDGFRCLEGSKSLILKGL
jgi:hypothetical protein